MADLDEQQSVLPLAASEQDLAPVSHTGPLFLTNRQNILEILSTGIIAPQAGYVKYYGDLLEHCPGRVPLFLHPIPPGAVDLVTDGQPGRFPVILELDAASIRGDRIPALSGELTPAEFSYPAQNHSGVAVATDCALPLASAIALHFRTEQEMREHTLRSYENIREDTVSLRVTPQLFQGRPADNAVLIDWLGSLQVGSAQPSSDFVLADRGAGALAMLVAAMPATPDWMQVAARAFGSAPVPPRGSGRATVPSETNIAPWLQLLPHRIGPGSRVAPKRTIDERVFLAIIQAFASQDPTTRLNPLEIIARVEDTLFGAKLTAAERRHLQQELDHARAVLRNEADLRFQDTAENTTVTRALLLVLLRPEPRRVISWREAPIAPSTETLVTAAVLSGYLYGWTALPVDLRTAPAFERMVSCWISRAINRMGAPRTECQLPVEPEPSVEVGTGADGSTTFRLMAAGEPVLSASRSLVDELLNADLSTGVYRDLALWLARRLKWDCGSTTLVLPLGSHALQTSQGQTQIAVSGFPQITYSLDSVRFQECLRQQGIPEEHLSEARRRLTVAAANPGRPGERRS